MMWCPVCGSLVVSVGKSRTVIEECINEECDWIRWVGDE